MTIPIFKQTETAFGHNADSGTINVIPQVNTNPGNVNGASYNKGFPEVTMEPAATTGLPPEGQDFNGILNEGSQLDVAYSVGAGFNYNAALYNNGNPYITGYPVGARVKRSDNKGYWLNTVDNNQTDPDSPQSEGWALDVAVQGIDLVFSVNGQSSITVTKLQAASNFIIVSQNSGIVPAAIAELIIPKDFSKTYQIINASSAELHVRTDSVSPASNIIVIGKALDPHKTLGQDFVTVVNVDYIISMGQYYLVRGYFSKLNNILTAFSSGGFIPLTTAFAVVPLIFGGGEINSIVGDIIKPDFACRVDIKAFFVIEGILNKKFVKVGILFNGINFIGGNSGYSNFATLNEMFLSVSASITMNGTTDFIQLVALIDATEPGTNAQVGLGSSSIDYIGQ